MCLLFYREKRITSKLKTGSIKINYITFQKQLLFLLGYGGGRGPRGVMGGGVLDVARVGDGGWGLAAREQR